MNIFTFKRITFYYSPKGLGQNFCPLMTFKLYLNVANFKFGLSSGFEIEID